MFDNEHKQRILDKLESLQKELHKKMGSLDKALGQLVSIGTTLGKFGKESKPMFDRVNETIKAILRVQNKGDNLPSSENQIGCEDLIKNKPLNIEEAELLNMDTKDA